MAKSNKQLINKQTHRITKQQSPMKCAGVTSLFPLKIQCLAPGQRTRIVLTQILAHLIALPSLHSLEK
jgi:hypothetical protein